MEHSAIYVDDHELSRMQPCVSAEIENKKQSLDVSFICNIMKKYPPTKESTITFNVPSHNENLDQSMLRLTIPNNRCKGLTSSSSALSVLSLILYFGVFSSFCSIIELGTWSCWVYSTGSPHITLILGNTIISETVLIGVNFGTKTGYRGTNICKVHF